MRLGSLRGVTILELSNQLPGPFATMLLSSLGAHVIKIEPPAGDPARHLDPEMFDRLNSKKSIMTLDLKDDVGLRELHDLVRGADVLIEGFRPGTLGRLGASYEHLIRVNERLVYCSISGYGQEGTYASQPGHDLNYLAIAGAIGGQHSGEIGIPFVDLAGGTTAALCVVSALRDVSMTGRGQFLDMALVDVAYVWANIKAPYHDPDAAYAEPTYGVFIAADGKPLALAVMEDHFWQRLCAAFHWTDWGADPSLATYLQRRVRHDEIRRRVGDTIRALPSDYWIDISVKFDLPFTPVNTRAEAASDPQVVARRLFEAGQIQAPIPAALRSVHVGTEPIGASLVGSADSRDDPRGNGRPDSSRARRPVADQINQ